MQYNPTKKEFYIAIAVGVLGLISFIIFGVATFNAVGKVKEEIGKTGEVEKGLEIALKINKQMVDLGSEMQTLDSFFVKSGEEAYFLEDLDNIAKSNKVKFATDSVNVKTSTGASDFDLLNVVIKYEGSFENVVGFLRSVQNMSKATIINSVELRGDESLWSGSASLSAYKIK